MTKLKGYVITLVVLLSLLLGVNITLSLTGACGFDSAYAVVVTLFGALLLFIEDAIVAWLTQKLPKKWINPYFWGYKIFKFEHKLYEILGIRRWKDRIPELGGQLRHFSKGHLQEHTPKYIYHFITETIYGEMAHTWSIVFGAFIFVVFPNNILNFALPLFLINTYLNLLPAMVQRYNRPKLCKIYERLLAKTEKMLYTENSNMLHSER